MLPCRRKTGKNIWWLVKLHHLRLLLKQNREGCMNNIGILAYGSLIEDPGIELKPLICERIKNVETPFNIEFARSSSSRDRAPTVVPVSGFGSPVKAIIMVLHEGISLEKAKDLLWRRETRKEGSSKHYSAPENPSPNKVVVATIPKFCGVEVVLYTQ